MKKSLILLTVPALFFLGCKPKPSPTPGGTNQPQPKACFTINKSLIDSGETITTSNCSTNASTYDWNFGLGLQSSSTANSPSWQYRDSVPLGIKPKRGTVYKISLIAFGTGSLKNEKDTNITVGERQIDSIRIVNIPVVPPFNYAPDGATKIAIQFWPGTNNANENTSPQLAPGKWPCTFNLDGLTPKIKIGASNNQAWRGRIINVTTSQTIYPFLSTSTPTDPIHPSDPSIYFSRGINESPIKITDNTGFDMEVYYSVVP